jgi:hypothetical protein
MQIYVSQPVIVAYPPPAPGVLGYTIPGNGGFYSWGTYGTTGVTNLKVVATDMFGNVLPNQPTVKVVSSPIPSPEKWAFALGNYANQSNFYLLFTFTLNGTPNQKAPLGGPYFT